LSTPVESNAITVTGITNPAAISITGGEYSVFTDDGGTWSAYSSTTPATVSLNNQVKVRQTSSSAYAATTDATLTIGGVSDTFSITTIPWPTVFTDNFTSGINPAHWTVNAGAYTIDYTQGDIRMSKPAGGGAWGSVIFNHDVYGDFDISVDYRDAVLAGCQNQIQLNLSFGGQYVANRRENWCDSRYSVWLDPGGTVGVLGTADTSWTLRVTRVGSTVTFYANGTQTFQGSFNNSPVTDLWLSLQNNGTDAAISVTFDNFIVKAADIVIPYAFTFTPRTEVPLGTTIVSNPITVTGISYPTSIAINAGGEYEINGSNTWIGTAGTVSPGDTVMVRLTSSVNYSTSSSATLTIGGVSGTFTVTTAPDLIINPVTTPSNLVTQTISGTVKSGATVTVSLNSGTAQPATVAGTNWSFTITGLHQGDNGITVNAIDNGYAPTKSATINCIAPQLTVTVTGTGDGNGIGGGAVTSSPAAIACTSGPCSALFDGLLPVTLIPTPNGDSLFSGWSGACIATSGDCEVTMPLDMNAGDRSTGAAFAYVLPAQIQLTGVKYPQISDAYAALYGSGTILAREFLFTNGLTLDKTFNILLKGGYNPDYIGIGGYSSIQGLVTVGKGSLTVERVVVK
jgi:hypothetical protein